MKRIWALALLALACSLPGTMTPDIRIQGTQISCPNATSASNFDTGDYHSFTCTWNCASFNGNDGVYVQLTYVWTGSTWKLDQTYTDRGICGGSFRRAATEP